MAEVYAEANPTFSYKQPIHETAVYDRTDGVNLTGFSLSTFIRAEKRGALRVRRQGRRVFYLGIDLLEWLKGGKANES